MPDQEGAKPLRLRDIATEIDGYLKQFEADPKLNVRNAVGKMRLAKYFMARAWHGGRYVYVRYVSYQGSTHLDRPQAEKYLAWLRQGGKGTHYKSGACDAD